MLASEQRGLRVLRTDEEDEVSVHADAMQQVMQGAAPREENKTKQNNKKQRILMRAQSTQLNAKA